MRRMKNKEVEVVAEEVGTEVAAVAIVDCEVGAVLDLLLRLGPVDVDDDADAVLVVVAHQPVEGVGRVVPQDPALGARVLRGVQRVGYMQQAAQDVVRQRVHMLLLRSLLRVLLLRVRLRVQSPVFLIVDRVVLLVHRVFLAQRVQHRRRMHHVLSLLRHLVVRRLVVY